MTQPAFAASDPKKEFARIKSAIESALESYASGGSEIAPGALQNAVKHTLLAPGKRFRPLLTVLTAQCFGGDEETALAAGSAGEMVHTASLILDDLPCMDDAPLRRGRASAHVEFGESTAILTAIALLNRAFGVIARMDAPDAIKTALSQSLSHAVGSYGLVAGQLADLDNHDAGNSSKSDVETINALKTGALIHYAVNAGANVANIGDKQRSYMTEFAHQIGLAFQLLDDFKDILLSDKQSGKTAQRDQDKTTLIALEGRAAALSRLRVYMSAANQALTDAGVPQDALLRLAVKQQFALIDGL